MYQTLTYTGASQNVEHGLAYGVVIRLMDRYLHAGHRLYVDNFYTTPLLFQDLLLNGRLACGTVHHNRRSLPTFSSSINRGNALFLKSGDLTLV